MKIWSTFNHIEMDFEWDLFKSKIFVFQITENMESGPISDIQYMDILST